MLFRYLSNKVKLTWKLSNVRALLLSSFLIILLGFVLIYAVDFENVSTTATIYISFEDKIDRHSISGNFFVEDSEGTKISGVASLSGDGKKIGFKPDQPFRAGETYKIIIKMGLMTEDGRHLPDERIITFTTKPDTPIVTQPPSPSPSPTVTPEKNQNGGGGASIPAPSASLLPAPSNSPMPTRVPIVFKDIGTEHWVNEYVYDLVSEGIITGYEQADGYIFMPDGLVTRQEFAKMIVLALGYSTKEYADINLPFYDNAILPKWSREYIATAYMKGIIEGRSDDKGTYFDFSANISRAEIVTIIGRAMNEGAIIEEIFSDYDIIPDWAVPYVALAVEKQIVSGYEDMTFRPYNAATRAEAAKIISNMMRCIKK